MNAAQQYWDTWQAQQAIIDARNILLDAMSKLPLFADAAFNTIDHAHNYLGDRYEELKQDDVRLL